MMDCDLPYFLRVSGSLLTPVIAVIALYIAYQQQCPEPYLNVQVENALVDRLLELFNATKLTSHQAKLLLDRVRVLIELGERVATKTIH